MDEVGEEHNPLMGLRIRNDLPCIREPVRDVCSQVSGRLELRICSSFTVEATHLPPAPDMFGCAEKAWTWALELECAEMDKQRRKKA